MKIFANVLLVAATLIAGGQVYAQGGKTVEYQEGLHYFLIDGAPATLPQPVEAWTAAPTECASTSSLQPA